MLLSTNSGCHTFLNYGFENLEGFKIYVRLAQLGNGNYYLIHSDNIGVILDNIDEKLDKHRAVLNSYYASFGSHSIPVSVDQTLKNITIDMSGKNANIDLTDPNNQTYTNATPVIDLNDVKLLKVFEPMPGQWQVTFSADASMTVVVSATSDLIIKYGFSIHPVKKIIETVFYPLKGFKNILTIWLSKSANLTEVHLVISKDIKKFPLDEVQLDVKEKSEGVLYKTTAFDVPNESFKIEVCEFKIYLFLE